MSAQGGGGRESQVSLFVATETMGQGVKGKRFDGAGGTVDLALVSDNFAPKGTAMLVIKVGSQQRVAISHPGYTV